MGREFGCSSSSSYDNEDDITASTGYTTSYNGSNANASSTGNNSNSSSAPSSSRLFQEAEELLQKGIETMFGGPLSCGLPAAARGCNVGPSGGGARGRQRRSGSHGSSDMYGDDDDDDVDEGVKLDWRKDPYHSMSDWTLIVRDGRTANPQTYHIHKTVVSYGNRKSGFLVKVFERAIMESATAAAAGGGRSGRSRKSNDGTTEVALPITAAQHVPQLLDFIYFDKLDLNAQNAPPLRHLANTFDVRELYALVSSFIQNDLSESTITTYIRESEAVKDKELLTLSMSIAANKFDVIPNDSLLILPPHVFQQLTSNPQLNYPSSERLSQRIATYVRGRCDEMNDEVFYFLTHAQILPTICPSEAMWYLNFACSKYGGVLVDDSMGGYEGTLKRRCIVAAARKWKDLLVDSIKEEVRRKVDGGGVDGMLLAGSGGGGGGTSMDGSPTRRRLFVDGDNETKLDKGRGYMSLPLDVRVELLEEALLNAAKNEGGGGVGVGSSMSGVVGATAVTTSSGQSSFESVDLNGLLSATEAVRDPATVKKERRGDSGKREKRKGRREKRGSFMT